MASGSRKSPSVCMTTTRKSPNSVWRKQQRLCSAAGAQEVVQEARYAHLVGGARMGNDPRTSVTNSFGRTHDIPNLFVCDGSILPTQGSANPGLTIQSLAARTADYLISNAERSSLAGIPSMSPFSIPLFVIICRLQAHLAVECRVSPHEQDKNRNAGSIYAIPREKGKKNEQDARRTPETALTAT